MYFDVGVPTAKFINDKIWRGEYWGKGGALDLAWTRYKLMVHEGNWHDAVSPFISACYSAAGNAKKHAEKTSWWNFIMKIVWLWRAYCYLERAHLDSDALFEKMGFSGMTVNDLDVRQSILRACGDHRGALDCIEYALTRDAEVMQTHTRGLLRAGGAAALVHEHYWYLAYDWAKEALEAAQACEVDEPRQATRIFRSLAATFHTIRHEDLAQECFAAAQRLAAEHSPDQAFKAS